MLVAQIEKHYRVYVADNRKAAANSRKDAALSRVYAYRANAIE